MLPMKAVKELASQIACDLLVSSECDSLPTDIGKALYYLDNIIILRIRNLEKDIDFWEPIDIPGYGLLIKNYDLYWMLVHDDTREQYIRAVILGLSYSQLTFLQEGEACFITDDEDAVLDFAEYLMAPDPILRECGFLDNVNIMNHTGLPFKSSLRKERKLKAPVTTRVSAIEKLLIHNFKEYIEKAKSFISV